MTRLQQTKWFPALKAAFPHTIPIFAGFWFLGLTYGIYMNGSGFSFVYPMLMSLTIFAGSVEFVAVNMLLGAFHPLQAFAMTLMINARQLHPTAPHSGGGACAIPVPSPHFAAAASAGCDSLPAACR